MRRDSLDVVVLSVIAVVAAMFMWMNFNTLAHIENLEEPEVVIVEKTEIVEQEVPVVVTETEVVTVADEYHWYRYKATGYSANDPSQGTTSIMASGEHVYEGAIAADWELLPLGTIVEIKGLDEWDGIYKVEDCGGAVIGAHIDIFCHSKSEAFEIGDSEVWLRVLKYGEEN